MDKKLTFNGKISDMSAMLVSAVRYALGRKTYIVSWTCEFVENNLHLMLERDIRVMIRDIKLQENKYGLGDSCDEEDWHNLLYVLQNYIKENDLT